MSELARLCGERGSLLPVVRSDFLVNVGDEFNLKKNSDQSQISDWVDCGKTKLKERCRYGDCVIVGEEN